MRGAPHDIFCLTQKTKIARSRLFRSHPRHVPKKDHRHAKIATREYLIFKSTIYGYKVRIS